VKVVGAKMLALTRGSLRLWVFLFAVLIMLPATASAYDTGAMSCDDIGQFAAGVVEGKEKGKTQREQLADIERIAPPFHRAERKIMRDIVRQLYTARYATLTPDRAFAAYRAECSAQQ
jgi:hypothetical protein